MTISRSAQTITVTIDARQQPVILHLGRRRLQVQRLLDEWEEAGCWWQGEETRRVYRVLAGGAVYELHHQPSTGWLLHHIYD